MWRLHLIIVRDIDNCLINNERLLLPLELWFLMILDLVCQKMILDLFFFFLSQDLFFFYKKLISSSLQNESHFRCL